MNSLNINSLISQIVGILNLIIGLLIAVLLFGTLIERQNFIHLVGLPALPWDQTTAYMLAAIGFYRGARL